MNKNYQSLVRAFCIVLPLLSIIFWSIPAIGVTVRYAFSIDGVASGQHFEGISDLFMDNKSDELYVLDQGNKRVVITNTDGVPLYQFNYTDAGVHALPVNIAVADDGKIYIAEEKRVVVTDYRGMYDHDMALSTIPDADKIDIQSIDIEGDTVYLGESRIGRVIVMDRKKEVFVTQFKEGVGKNFHIAINDNGIYIRDSAAFSIFHLDRNGKPLGRFGMISGLAGGFSMIVDMDVHKKNGRVVVVDTNRVAVIFFDRDGKFLFELGGPEIFRWPRAVAVDNKDRVYISDATNKIRVFQIIEDVPATIETKSELQPEATPVAPPVAEPKKDEVQKIVEEEGRLLPFFFAVDSAKLKKSDLLILNKNAAWLKKNPDAKINVRGYADERGTDEYNLTLSKKRAKAVMDYFVKQGIDSKRLKFVGYGKELTTDKSETGFARSRRVDFLVVK